MTKQSSHLTEQLSDFATRTCAGRKPPRSDLVPREECGVADTDPQGFSVADLCCRWRVGADKIRAFLHRGELVGVNVATNFSARPQWRITRKSVELFELRRSSAPPPKPPKRRRRQTNETDFYPD
jgi:hypothetical protein